MAFFVTGAAQVKVTGRLGRQESKFSDMMEAILDFTEKGKKSILGKMDKGFIQDDMHLGGGWAWDKIMWSKVIDLAHKFTNGIILKWHFFPQNDIDSFFFQAALCKNTQAKSFGLVARQPPCLGHKILNLFYIFKLIHKNAYLK